LNGGEQQGDQHRHDGDDDEEFDECETPGGASVALGRVTFREIGGFCRYLTSGGSGRFKTLVKEKMRSRGVGFVD